MDLGVVKKNKYGDEYVYINYHDKMYRFVVSEAYTDPVETIIYNQYGKDFKIFDNQTVIKLIEVKEEEDY